MRCRQSSQPIPRSRSRPPSSRSASRSRSRPSACTVQTLRLALISRSVPAARCLFGMVERGSGRFQPRCGGRSKNRPGATERDRAPVCDFHDPVNTCKQCAVMAGHDDAATPAAQKLCNQRAPAGVEVVGGLVEQQDIGRFLEHAGKGQTCALPAAERAERVRGGDPGQPGAGQRVRQPVLQRPVRRARVLDAAFAAQQTADARRPMQARPPAIPSACAMLPPGCRTSCRIQPTVPARVMAPAPGSTAPASSRKSVDLPQPLRPARPALHRSSG